MLQICDVMWAFGMCLGLAHRVEAYARARVGP